MFSLRMAFQNPNIPSKLLHLLGHVVQGDQQGVVASTLQLLRGRGWKSLQHRPWQLAALQQDQVTLRRSD